MTPTYRTKDFAAIEQDGEGFYLAPLRYGVSRIDMHEPDRAAAWLGNGDGAQGLLSQFWSPERGRFEAADEDEAYALLVSVQKTYNERGLN